jgi:hypothetical protein
MDQTALAMCPAVRVTTRSRSRTSHIAHYSVRIPVCSPQPEADLPQDPPASQQHDPEAQGETMSFEEIDAYRYGWMTPGLAVHSPGYGESSAPCSARGPNSPSFILFGSYSYLLGFAQCAASSPHNPGPEPVYQRDATASPGLRAATPLDSPASPRYSPQYNPNPQPEHAHCRCTTPPHNVAGMPDHSQCMPISRSYTSSYAQ